MDYIYNILISLYNQHKYILGKIKIMFNVKKLTDIFAFEISNYGISKILKIE